MPRVPREPPSPSVIVPAVLRYLVAHGRDAGALAARLGLGEDAAERDEIDLVPSALEDVLAGAAALEDDPHLALRLAGELPLRRYGLAELAARSCTTLGDALDQIARHAPTVHPHLAFARTGATWHQATPSHPRGIGRHVHELALAYLLAQLAGALGEPLPLERVWFAHARPRDLARLEQHFGTDELAFGAEDCGFSFASAHLERRLVTADPRLHATIAPLAERAVTAVAQIRPRVAAIVRARLPEPTSADDAAAVLHMSARTLQRRLEGEGTTFSAIVDATRELVARELLGDPSLALAEIGYRVGFADLASFSRAFKRWVGVSPGRFRSA